MPILRFDPDPENPRVPYCDLEKLIATKALLMASSGGGKSYLLRYLLEQTFGRVQHIVFDPEGELSTLREKFDYLLAGRDGDIPTNVKTAGALCERVVELQTSLIIDLYELKKSDRSVYVKNFLEKLMHLPRELWHPILVIIDEADLFCPEKGKGESVAADAVINLCSRGRKRGFAAILATQRLAKLNKDAAFELLNKFIGRTGGDNDLKRAAEELSFTKANTHDIRDLEPGTWFAFGPAISLKTIMVRGGEIQTKHLRPGELAPPTPPPTEKLRALLADISDLDAAAEIEIKTVHEAQSKIGVLESEIKALKKLAESKSASLGPGPSILADGKTESALRKAHMEEIKALQKEFNEKLETIIKTKDARIKELESAGSKLGKAAGPLLKKLAEVAALAGELQVFLEGGESVVPEEISAVVPDRDAKVVQLKGKSDLSPALLNVINSLKFLESVKNYPCSKDTLAAITGLSPTASTLPSYISVLTKSENMEKKEGGYALTQRGQDAVTEVVQIEDRKALHKAWYSRITPAVAAILKILIDAYPEGLTQKEICDLTGLSKTASTLPSYLSVLKKRGLTEKDKSKIRAAVLLFPKGLN